MIENLIRMLKLSDWENVSENVEIAKGKHKIQTTFKGVFKSKRRAQKFERWQKKEL